MRISFVILLLSLSFSTLAQTQVAKRLVKVPGLTADIIQEILNVEVSGNTKVQAIFFPIKDTSSRLILRVAIKNPNTKKTISALYDVGLVGNILDETHPDGVFSNGCKDIDGRPLASPCLQLRLKTFTKLHVSHRFDLTEIALVSEALANGEDAELPLSLSFKTDLTSKPYWK